MSHSNRADEDYTDQDVGLWGFPVDVARRDIAGRAPILPPGLINDIAIATMIHNMTPLEIELWGHGIALQYYETHPQAHEVYVAAEQAIAQAAAQQAAQVRRCPVICH